MTIRELFKNIKSWVTRKRDGFLGSIPLTDDERQNRYADEDELADAGFDYVADEEVDASYADDDEGDEF